MIAHVESTLAKATTYFTLQLKTYHQGPRYGKNSPMRRAVWDIEKLTLPHIRRKAYKARPFLMVDPINGCK